MNLSVLDYIIEEVGRQGHDTNVFTDGGVRVGWMLAGWEYAVGRVRVGGKPDLNDMITIGKRVERIANADGIRTCNVWVGHHPTPRPEVVQGELLLLDKRRDDLAPLEYYRAFETIHPFLDGNGRTGKILLNWLNGTLNTAPIFPPNNFWGHPVRNP